MSQDSLKSKVERLLELRQKLWTGFKTLNSESDSYEFARLWKQALDLRHSITEDLIENPGVLIHIEADRIKEAQKAIDSVWNPGKESEMVQGLVDGEFPDLSFNLAAGCIERAIKLKPLFIAVQLNKEITCYFQEAMSAWVHGRFSAALILCWSVLENLIKEKVTVALRKGTYRGFDQLGGTMTCNQLINKSEEVRLLQHEDARNAGKIKKMRDCAVHGLRAVSEAEAYDAIVKTRTIVERLLTPIPNQV